jgi:hypothetical protein
MPHRHGRVIAMGAVGKGNYAWVRTRQVGKAANGRRAGDVRSFQKPETRNQKPETRNQKPETLFHPVADRPDGGAGTRIRAELGEDVLDVFMHGPPAEEQLVRDLLIGPVPGDQAKDLSLARR